MVYYKFSRFHIQFQPRWHVRRQLIVSASYENERSAPTLNAGFESTVLFSSNFVEINVHIAHFSSNFDA